jgi:hypothetical protein
VEEINMYDSLNDNSEPQMSNEDLAKEIQRLSRKLDESNNLKMDKISKPNGSGLIKAGGIMTLVISCLAFIAVGIATLFPGMIFMAFLNVLSIPSIVLNALAQNYPFIWVIFFISKKIIVWFDMIFMK